MPLDRLEIAKKEGGNGADHSSLVERVAVLETRVGTMDASIDKLNDHIIPNLSGLIDRLDKAMAKYDTATGMAKKIAGWAMGILTTLATGVIAAHLLKVI